jgi:hypothetical protein
MREPMCSDRSMKATTINPTSAPIRRANARYTCSSRIRTSPSLIQSGEDLPFCSRSLVSILKTIVAIPSEEPPLS